MISVVFGKPGAGKTAYLVANCLKYLGNTREALNLKRNSIAQVTALQGENNYSFPDRPPVYTNFPVSAHVGYQKRRDSYYIDGFSLGFQNEFVPVRSVFPGSFIAMTEVQRYYNSRVPAKEFPDWVSRYFEEHRHFGLQIMLDLQRLGLLDLNIRELGEEFVEVVDVQHETNWLGTVQASEFTLRKWSRLSAAEAYINSDKLHNYDEVVERFDGNVFDAYQSRSYFDAFLPEMCDFSQLGHNITVGKDLSFRKLVYRQEAPYGFYKSEAAKILAERKKMEGAA